MPESLHRPNDTSPSLEEGILFAEVSVFVGSDLKTSFKVAPGTHLIGSDLSCHLVVQAKNVARMHARLSYYGHRLSVEDLESAGGVFIGGTKICLPTPVQPGTEVHIGDARLRFDFPPETLSRMHSDLADPQLGLEIIRSELSQEPYQVLDTLAQGGMGVVLKARDHRIHRSVAMKVLKSGNEFSAEKLMRFVSEAQLTGQLEHPNIVPVYQLGISSDGQIFYTMKYVRGQTLAEILAKLKTGDPETTKQYSLSALLTVFMKVADAMAFAHARGVLHRDLKPQNIMIGAFGEVLVMDWGLAKRIAGGDPSPLHESARVPISLPSEGRFETMQGLIAGTPPYLSPEQAAGKNLDNRSDIHVMGTILYEILSLQSPLILEDLDRVVQAIAEGDIIPLSERVHTPFEGSKTPPPLAHCPSGKLPESLVAIVEKAMQHEPALRYQSIQALQDDIIAYQNGFAPSAEQAGFVRQLQLLLGRRRREALIIACFLVLSQLLLAYFLGRIASDRKKLRINEKDLAAKNVELRETNQRLEQIIDELSITAERNYRDALTLLRQKQGQQALSMINLALVSVKNAPKTEARYLLIRGHANTQLGFYAEALDDYHRVSFILPDLLPINQIEIDLSRSLEDGSRPLEGWSWEKIEFPNGLPKTKGSPRNQPPPIPPPPTPPAAKSRP